MVGRLKTLRRHEARMHEDELLALERASEARYRQLADAMPQIVWTADAAGKTLYFNRRWSEYTGLDPADGLDTQLRRSVLHPDDLAPTLARRDAAIASGGLFEIEYRLRRRDGVYRWHL